MTGMTQNEAEIRRRAEEIFLEQQGTIWKQTDRMFLVLMPLQWFTAIALSLIVSPLRWEGTEGIVHLHVWSAILLGGVITALPVYAGLMWSGQRLTRQVMGVAQMLMGALLIHLTGGRIETHFHVFGSLAFIAFYRDPWVLLPATVVVALDHAIRGVIWPQSVYGVLTASPWRSVEHAAWVVFEDIFLVRSIFYSLGEMRGIADHQARLEDANKNIENRVLWRTSQLREDEERFRALLESAPLAMLQTDADGRCLYGNALCRKLVSAEEIHGRRWTEWVHPEDRAAAEQLEKGSGDADKELRLANGKGGGRKVRARGKALRGEDGQTLGRMITLEEVDR